MAHTKAAGSTRHNKDSISKRLGVKLFGGEKAKIGSIIIRQKGSRVRAGKGVAMGNDYTIFANRQGIVNFRKYHDKLFIDVV